MQAAWRRSVVLLLACSASQVVAVDLLKEPSAALPPSPVDPLRVAVSTAGSLTAGCSLCRDSGNCSIAMNDTSSGVFCGDLYAAATIRPCCCPYYTECRINRKALTCECGGPWPLAAQFDSQRHERLASMNEEHTTKTQIPETYEPETGTEDTQMAVSTEILIHLSAYLAFFVFAVYVDQCVDCFSDCRRNQMVAYRAATDEKLLRFRQRFGKRRQSSDTDTENEDNRPLLVVSPAPARSPVFTFDKELDSAVITDHDKEEQEVVVVTIPVDQVQEVSANPSDVQESTLPSIVEEDLADLVEVDLDEVELQEVEPQKV